MINLVDNAIKYAYSNRKLELTINVLKHKDYVDIIISGHGVGLSLSSDLSQIFVRGNLGQKKVTGLVFHL